MTHHQPICKICGQRAATIFITRMVNGQPQEEELCESCAHEHTQGEEWLKSMASKFGLPETASLDQVMQGIAEKMPLLGEPLENTGDETSNGEIPDLILEANLHLSGDLSSHEFPSDEDAADALDDAWADLEFKYMAPLLEETGGDAEEIETPFDEISYEAMKASWLGEAASTPPHKSTAPKEKEAPREIVAERCPKCGTTWDRLREDGRAGCAQCYVAFHDKLIEIMNRMQREAQHVGKAPRAAQKRRRRLEHLRLRRDHRLEMLNRRLQEAVAAENYEDAAQLRDKIKMVSSTIVSDQS
jgi:protein-arginine kinase activator protein McsA